MVTRGKLIAGALGFWLFTTSPATAATIGSNLATASNGSVCKFQVSELKTQICTVDQRELLTSHTAAAGLVVPFDGVVVRWSVVSGPALPGTGKVTMALRATQGPGYLEVGPAVDLPLNSPGSRFTYAERLPVTAGQLLGLRIAIENRSVQEAGAPLAFAESGVGTTDLWWGDPGWAAWDEEPGAELLLDAEIEPDGDHDGYGDLTQDCFPNHSGDQALCGHDLVPPTIRPRFAARQSFLRSGTVVVRVSSNEAGIARARGEMRIDKNGSGTAYVLRSARRSIQAGGEAVLRLRLRKKALKMARSGAAEGKKIVVTGRVGVLDAAGNEGQAPIRVRLRRPPTSGP